MIDDDDAGENQYKTKWHYAFHNDIFLQNSNVSVCWMYLSKTYSHQILRKTILLGLARHIGYKIYRRVYRLDIILFQCENNKIEW